MQFVKPLAKHLLPEKYHPAARRLRRLQYLGTQRYCPCCGGRYRTFLPYGVHMRPDAQCPGCGSVERHRLVWLYLQNRTNLLKETATVLHFAPESSLRSLLVALPNIQYMSTDLLLPSVTFKSDITQIPVKDNTFDVVLCMHVLEHIMDEEQALRSIYNILKPGGWAILQSPIGPGRDQTFEDNTILAPNEREYFFGQQDHVRIYGRDYAARLEQAGFHVTVDNYVKTLGIARIQKYGLTLNEAIHLCKKPASARG